MSFWKMTAEKDKKKARYCLNCPLCRYARKRQKGVLFGLVKKIAEKFCPFCIAYEKINGRKAHEPIHKQNNQ